MTSYMFLPNVHVANNCMFVFNISACVPLCAPGLYSLQTVEQPSVEVGRTMARLIVDRIEGRAVERVTILPTQLVEGDSA